MNHKDRFFATINNAPVDKPASWLGLPVPAAEPGLKKYFGVNSIDELKIVLDDDIYPIEVPYNYPSSNHIACAFDFAEISHLDKPDDRTLTAPGFFEDYSEPADVDKFNWPDPAKYIDREESKRRAKAVNENYASMGIMWSAHFQDACSAFGMEQALMTMILNPEMFQAVIDRITVFYLKANEIFYESTKGFLDVVFYWVPDHNWGGSGMIGLQEILLQTNGDTIYLFPAWPQDWDVHFKLHAPKNTWVEAELKNGKEKTIQVEPEFRKKDIETMKNPAAHLSWCTVPGSSRVSFTCTVRKHCVTEKAS